MMSFISDQICRVGGGLDETNPVTISHKNDGLSEWEIAWNEDGCKINVRLP